MKKIYLILLAVLGIATAQAQAPKKLNYQGVVRDAGGAPMTNQAVGLRISIVDNSSNTLYQETQAVTTNAFGLYNIQIGSGTVVSGSMGSVGWLTGERLVKVEMDPTGGTGYVAVGSPATLNSVPYALGANGVISTNNGGDGLVGTSTSSLWWGFYEAGTYRGYLGSYSGKNEDVDIGTGAGNSTGSMHLTIGAVPKLTVDSIGNVGIGTRFPGYRLRVDGITGSFSDNGIRIQNTTANTGWNFYASSSGNLIVGKSSNLGQFDGTTGAYSTISDSRLKSNIRPLENVMPKLMAMEIKRYEFKHDNPTNKTSIGVIAQELQQQFPEYVTVHKNNDGNPLVQDQLGVDYAGLSVIALKAIQEQQAVIAELQRKVAELERRLTGK